MKKRTIKKAALRREPKVIDLGKALKKDPRFKEMRRIILSHKYAEAFDAFAKLQSLSNAFAFYEVAKTMKEILLDDIRYIEGFLKEYEGTQSKKDRAETLEFLASYEKALWRVEENERLVKEFIKKMNKEDEDR